MKQIKFTNDRWKIEKIDWLQNEIKSQLKVKLNVLKYERVSLLIIEFIIKKNIIFIIKNLTNFDDENKTNNPCVFLLVFNPPLLLSVSKAFIFLENSIDSKNVSRPNDLRKPIPPTQ